MRDVVTFSIRLYFIMSFLIHIPTQPTTIKLLSINIIKCHENNNYKILHKWYKFATAPWIIRLMADKPSDRQSHGYYHKRLGMHSTISICNVIISLSLYHVHGNTNFNECFLLLWFYIQPWMKVFFCFIISNSN